MPKWGISYRIYLHKKVKHKPVFFGRQVCPVYLIVTFGHRSLNFKSHIFSHLLKEKYQFSLPLKKQQPTVEDIMEIEKQLIEFILRKHRHHIDLEAFRWEYLFYSFDILDAMDEQYKRFLVDFFEAESVPSIAHLIASTTGTLTTDVILQDLQKSLSPVIRKKMLRSVLLASLPYIPLSKFNNSKNRNNFSIMPLFRISEKKSGNEAILFFRKNYPNLEFDLENYLAELKDRFVPVVK